jgi:hypothetical protein
MPPITTDIGAKEHQRRRVMAQIRKRRERIGKHERVWIYLLDADLDGRTRMHSLGL